MKHAFECLNCHHRFEADDQNTVVCPKCQSDNVDFARFHIPKGMWKWGAALLALVVVGGLVISVCKRSSGTANEQKKEQQQTTLEVGNKGTIKIVEVADLPNPPKVEIVGNKPTFTNGGYSFTVSIIGELAGRNVYVAVCDCVDNSKIIARSNEKQEFKGVPASEHKGKYFLGVFDAESNTLLGGSERSGFLPIEPAGERMTEKQLQELIDNLDPSLEGSGLNKLISPSVKIQHTGIDASKTKNTFSEVLTKLDNGDWESVEVTNVEHDEMNLVSSVTLKVVPYSE
jgi:hypothetical protein